MTIQAAALMTQPAVTVLPQASLREIADLLAGKGIGAVPVCNPDGTLAGIVHRDRRVAAVPRVSPAAAGLVVDVTGRR